MTSGKITKSETPPSVKISFHHSIRSSVVGGAWGTSSLPEARGEVLRGDVDSFIDFFIQLLHIWAVKSVVKSAPNPVDSSDEILQLKIEDLSRGGAGVARIDTPEGKQVVFVPLSLPGDVVRAQITRREKRFTYAELVEIIEPSSDRVTPRCAVFGQCGGCSWQHVPYAMQWKVKREGVLHALSRTQVEVPGTIDEFPAEHPWGYRNRIQLRGRETNGEIEMGFFARGSRSLVPIERCEIAREELNAALPGLRKQAKEKNQTDFKLEIDVKPDAQVRAAWNERHAALGFRQVNDEQNEKLRAYVSAQLTPGVHLLDLFGGSGNLSYHLAEKMKHIDCVDVGAPRGGFEGQPGNYKFFQSDTAKWLVRQAASKKEGRFPFQGPFEAILDPPREGLADASVRIIDSLLALKVDRLVFVGCDPDSFARDLSRLTRRGYQVTRLAAFDLFPQTPHVESVAVLESSV